jgi:hypothetical protein
VIGNGLSLFTIPRDEWSFEIFLRNSAFSILIGFTIWRGIVLFVNWLDIKIPWLKFPIKRLIVQVLALITISGLVIAAGISIMVWGLKDFSFQDMNSILLDTLKITFAFLILSILVTNSIFFFIKWRNSAIQQEELKRAHLAMQYQTLKNQIQPHFLFNSLSSLVTLINTDQEKATLFVHKLSDVYRYVLEQRESEMIPVSEELKFLEDYLFLQKIRFGENLRVNISLEPVAGRMVIPLSLQMLVENAIKHNEISGEHPLSIDISSSVELSIVIKNSLNKKNVVDNSLGVGIENLKKRVAFFTDQPLIIEEKVSEFFVTMPTVST